MKFRFFERKHLNNVCMNYFKHAKFSFKISGSFFIGTIGAFFHAILPNIFPNVSKHC